MSSVRLPILLLALGLLATALVPQRSIAQDEESVPITYTQHTRVVIEGIWTNCHSEMVGSHDDPVSNGDDGDYTIRPSNGKQGNTPSEWTGQAEDIPGVRITFFGGSASSSSPSGDGGEPADCSETFNGHAAAWAGFTARAYYTPPENEPPEACFDYEATDERFTISFDASCSEDDDGEIVSYDWDFGDDKSGSGMLVQHTYDRRGEYEVTLTVRDDDDDEGDENDDVEVEGPDLRYVVSLVEQADGASKLGQEDDPTFEIGDTVRVEIAVENTGDWTLEEIQLPEGEETIAVEPDSALAFVGTERDQIAVLDPGKADTLVYLYEAQQAGSLVASIYEVTAEAVHPDTGERTTYSETETSCSFAGKGGAIQDEEENVSCANGDVNAAPVLVNSTGDAGLKEGINPVEDGCTTGEMVTLDDGTEKPECTLRAALTVVNASGGAVRNTIKFDIPEADANCSADFGCAIVLEKALPPVECCTTIDGTTQPGYDSDNPFQIPVITLTGNGGIETGLRLVADQIEVKGMQINAFTGAGIEIQGDGARVVRSWVGNNGMGIHIVGGADSAIGSLDFGEDGGEIDCPPNVIYGNTEAGMKIEAPASGTQILCNNIGVLPALPGTSPNGTGILIDESASNEVVGSLIAGNTGVGVHIRGIGATGNKIRKSRIGGLPELGTEGNAWGVVIESASNNTIGQGDSSSDPIENFVTGNTQGEVLIFSEDPSAPANGNLVHRNGVGTDLSLKTNTPEIKAEFGIVISGSASNNIIGPYTPGDYSNIIGRYNYADVAVFTAEANGNKILSGSIGAGYEILEDETPPDTDGWNNIYVQGAQNTVIGTLAEGTETSSSILLGNTRSIQGKAILLTGYSSSKVTLSGRSDIPEMQVGLGTQTSVQGVKIGIFGKRYLERWGIYVSSASHVQIGPEVEISTCFLNGIIFLDTHDSVVHGTHLKLACRFSFAGIDLSHSSHNRIGTTEADPTLKNVFENLRGIVIESRDQPGEKSNGNRIVGNRFGSTDNPVDEGIVLKEGATNTIIGGADPNVGNHFINAEKGIVLDGAPVYPRLPYLPLTGTIIEGNTFGSEDITNNTNDTAIEVLEAYHTRIGGTTQSGSVGGNTIRNYKRGIVVQRPSDQEGGTVIYGNSIYDTEENGIIGWQSLLDRFQDPFRLPVANISVTKTNLNSTVSIKGSVGGFPDRLIYLQFFRSDACRGVSEGRDYLTHQSVMTDAQGRARFEVEVEIEEGDGLTVTATDPTDQRTSEFSPCYTHAADGQSTEVAFDAGTGDTIMDEAGIVARVAAIGKMSITDTLYVTAYPNAPLGDRFTGEAALAHSGRMILPRSATTRYWHIETAGPADAFALDLCLDASDLSDNEREEAVVIQRSQTFAGRWVPHETHLETHDGTPYACASVVAPTGDFGFGSGSEAVLATPVLTAPENNATDVDLSTSLSWQAVPETASYHVQIALDAGFATLLVDTTGLASAMVKPDSLSRSQMHYWRVRGVAATGEVGPWSPPFRFTTGDTGVNVEDEPTLPEGLVLEPNYPNPFNPQTTIGYSLPEASHVRLAIYDALGRQVSVLVDGPRPAGRHETVFDAARLPSGVYLYRMTASNQVRTGRMMLLK